MSGGQYAFYDKLLHFKHDFSIHFNELCKHFCLRNPMTCVCSNVYARLLLFSCLYWSWATIIYCVLCLSTAARLYYTNSLEILGLEHTLPAHQLFEYFYNGFPSCLIGYPNLRNKLIDSSFDSLRAVPIGDWWVAWFRLIMQRKVCRKVHHHYHFCCVLKRAYVASAA